ncbi:MAG: hypothetical protein M0030_21955 [Actinomycetota bacterium]|nr:hypothetical protein [Actinomycetota bacterium]
MDIVDIGVPFLHNTSGRRVRVLGIALASAPAAVRLLAVAAYLTRRDGWESGTAT